MSGPAPRDYFLPPQNYSDYQQYRGAVRIARDITPIVDGAEIFRALEEAIAAAEKWVLIAFWAFDPTVRLISDAGKKGGRSNWLDLVIDVAKKGVLVRILMNDFDPGFKAIEHAMAWLRFRALLTRAERDGVPADKFQVVCARHDAEIPAASVKLAGQAAVYEQLADDLNKKDEKERVAIFANAPGLWEKLEFQTKTKTIVPKKKGEAYPAYPAAYHQKIILVDGRVGFTGGVNLIEGNLDTRKHSGTLPLPWHDVFVRIEGEPLRDLRRNFIGIWNIERKRSEAFLTTALGQSPVKMPTQTTTDLREEDVPMAAPDQSKPQIFSQVHRTVAKKSTSPNGVPDPVRQDILEGYQKAIGLAEQYIYIENQYFREQAVADAIIAQHKKQKDLRTIIVVPKIAEELLKSSGDAITRHGAYLQHEALEKMKTAIGRNLGLFAMVVGDPETVVYVHSKLLIIDDVFAGIGSANTNPRSFRMDTELHLAWHDRGIAKKLRIDLWNELLGSPRGMSGWKPKDFVDEWSALAKANASAAASRRKGFVVPFANDVKGDKHPLLPDELA